MAKSADRISDLSHQEHDRAKDFPGTLKMMAGQGYQLVEMCSPQGYVSSGFGPLVNIKPAEIEKLLRCRT